MASQTTKSTLAAKLGERGRRAHDAHRCDEINWGFSDLPAGIVGGIAQLATITHGVYKPNTQYAGQPWVRLEGRALEPTEWDGIRVADKPVSIMLPICDTPGKKLRSGAEGTFDNRYADFLSELKKLSDEAMIARIEESDLTEIDEICAELEVESPFFNFSTRGWKPPASKEEPNPVERVFVSFDGRCDYNSSEAGPGFGTEDDSTSEASFDDGATEAPAKGNGTAHMPTSRIKQEDIDDVYRDENDEDEPAGGAAEDVPISDTPEMAPEKGDLFNFRPMHPVTKRKSAKPVEVEVDTLSVRLRTATVHETADKKKVYKDVSWDDLEQLN